MDQDKKPLETQDQALTLDDDQRVKTLSPTALVAKRFFRNRLALVGLAFIIGMFLFSFLGGFLMPYEEDQVFKKYEEMYKIYAGISVNEDLKYVVKEEEDFSLIARSQLMLALGNEEQIFEAEDQTYFADTVADDFNVIFRSEEIGMAMTLKGNTNVSLMDGYSDDLAKAIQAAVIADETLVTIDGQKYLIDKGPKNSIIYELKDIALTTSNIYDFASQDTPLDYDFVKSMELLIAGAANGTASVSEEHFTLETDGDIIRVSLDGNPYAAISDLQIEPIYDDVFLDLPFKERIREAIAAEEESFTYPNADGEEEIYRLYRQDLQWTLEHQETTYLIDEYSYPDSTHLLGTDGNGMDILTRLMYGGRISLRIGFLVVIIETFIGIILGGIAGYFGKFWDNLIMRIVDVFNCIPSLPLIIILGAMMDQVRTAPEVRLNVLMFILAILGWPSIARMVRGQTLTLREQEFMSATEALGLPIRSRIFKHLIPNIVPQLIVICTLSLGSVILMESVLSFLGVGVKFPFASWGNIINAVSNVHVLSNYLFVWIPAGLCILITVLGFNFIGDGLRDAFDPKMKR